MGNRYRDVLGLSPGSRLLLLGGFPPLALVSLVNVLFQFGITLRAQPGARDKTSVNVILKGKQAATSPFVHRQLGQTHAHKMKRARAFVAADQVT